MSQLTYHNSALYKASINFSTRRANFLQYPKNSRLMKIKLLLLGLLVWATQINAQEDIEMQTEQSCGLSVKNIAIPPMFEFASNAEAVKIMNDMMKVVGLKPNFKIQAADVPNAAAVVMGTTRFILYNPKFIKNVDKDAKTKWSSISILAHELGHHLNGHTLSNQGSRPKMELEADEFSGFVLRKMGATLEEAQAAMNLLASPFPSISHPAKAGRLRAIERGWRSADSMYGNTKEPENQPIKDVPTTEEVAKTDPTPREKEVTPDDGTMASNGSNSNHSTNSAPVPQIRQHPDFALYRIDLYANPSSFYYLAKNNDFVLVRGTSVRILGKLKRIKDKNYTSVIKMTANTPDLFVAKGGLLVTERGNTVGKVSRLD